MNKILVPYDFSDISKNALDFACQLAGKAGATITLFHVIEHPSASRMKTMGISDADPMEVLYIKRLIEQTRVKMDETLAEANTGTVVVKQEIKLGNPEQELIEEVDSDDIDLIIMGTQGAEGMQEFLEGSYSERVVRNADCPVLTVNEKTNIETIKELVFASDFEMIPEDFVQRLLSFRKLLRARLRIVIINTPASFTSSRLDNKLLDKFIAKYNIDNYTTEIYNYSNEEDGIIAYAEDIGAHMIALGTNQVKGVKHFLRGSIAEDVVNHSPLPVWTYHLRD